MLTMPSSLRTVMWLLVILGALSQGGLVGAQSTDPNAYVLLARDGIRVTGLQVTPGRGGHVGVIGNGAVLVGRSAVDAAGYQIVAPVVRFDGTASCSGLFAHEVRGATPSCGQVFDYVQPFEELGPACEFPPAFPPCDPLAVPIIVRHGETRRLEPGTYGDLKVEGGGAGPGTLILGGEYRFCNVHVSRRGRIVAEAPTRLFIQGVLTTSNSAQVAPAAGRGLEAQDLRLVVGGSRIRLARRGKLRGHVCAPRARMNATSATVVGRLVVGSLRARRLTLELSPLVTMTTTTTSTTQPSLVTTTTSTTDPCAIACGKPECNPVCQPEDDSPCSAFTSSKIIEEPGSCEGAILGLECSRDCSDDCKTVTFARCEAPSTTTIVPTTSTTTVPPVTTTSTTAATSTTAPPLPSPELCGNCLDDDGDGLVDLADPDCCAAANRFVSEIRRAKIRTLKRGSGLRLRAMVARGGLSIDPRADEVSLLLSGPNNESYLCAVVPAGKMRKVGRTLRINNKRATVTSLQGIQRLRFKQRKKGQLLLRAAGKQVRYAVLPKAGQLAVTVGFRSTTGTTVPNRCAQAAIRVQPSKNRKALRYP